MRTGKLVVATALAVLCGSGAAAAPARSGAGGNMNGVSVKRVGTVVPGVKKDGPIPDVIDGTPVVLWAGTEPAGVVLHRSRPSRLRKEAVQELETIPESVTGALRGGVKLESRTPLGDGQEDRADGFQVRTLVTADLDGDGVEELLVAHQRGGVEVAPWKGTTLRLPAPGGLLASYRPQGVHVARLAGRAEVYLLLGRRVHDETAKADVLSRMGAGEPYALVRADRSGLSRVTLELAPVHEVLAVGAINRPGSAGVDELYALYRKDAGDDLWLSRHRPDGGLVAAPRRVYAPATAGTWEAGFVAQSRSAVLWRTDAPEVLFVEPEAPVNWAHGVSLGPVVGQSADLVLGVADGGTTPKLVFRHGDGVYAVDAEGHYQAVSGGAFAAVKGTAPFHRLEAKDADVLVVPSVERGDEYLVVRARKAGLRGLEHDELSAAADRFIEQRKLARRRRRAEPSLNDDDIIRDQAMKEERARRGVTEPIRTVEEWRSRLPDSYAADLKDRRGSLDAFYSAELTWPLDRPESLDGAGYRDPDGLRAWLAARTGVAEVRFEVVGRGAVMQAFRLEGEMGGAPTDLARSIVEWRKGPAGAVVVTTAVLSGEKRSTQPGVYVLRAAVGER